MENTNASFNILVILALGLQSFVISMLWFSHCSLEEKILSLLNKPDEIVSEVDEAEAEESIESEEVDEVSSDSDDGIESEEVDEVPSDSDDGIESEAIEAEAEVKECIESEAIEDKDTLISEQKSIKPEEKSYWFFM